MVRRGNTIKLFCADNIFFTSETVPLFDNMLALMLCVNWIFYCECRMFVSTAKRLRVLKSSDLSASTVSPSQVHYLQFTFFFKIIIHPMI
jgi:hypothetical protein